MIWNTLLIALREIVRNKMRSALTTLGVVIGVGAVIAMVMLGDGATANVTSNISALGEDLLVLTPGGGQRGPGGVATVARPFEISDATAIEREIPGLKSVAPSAARSALVVVGAKNWRTQVIGTVNSYFTIQNFELRGGRWMNEGEISGGTAVCIIGSTVSNELFGRVDPVGESIRIGKLSCRIVGALAEKSGSSIRDPNDVVVMPLRAFHRRVAGNRDVSAVNMTFAKGRSSALVSHQITLLMRERRGLSQADPDDFDVRDMKEIMEAMAGVTGVLTTLLGSIAAISLIVGGIGIMNIMLVSVTERTREIGIRLAVGARAREVLMQFLIEAIVLATLGGIVGVFFGITLGYVTTGLLGMPFILSIEIICVALLFSVFVGVLFGFLPARKAARLKPIEALRHE